MKNILAFLFGWLIAAVVLLPQAHAAVVATPIVQGYTASSGRFASAAGSFSMTAANDGFIKPAVLNVGGRAVTMPATLRLAANAGQVALSGMRLNPWLLAGSLALPWLADQGMQYVDGQGWLYGVPLDGGGTGPMLTDCASIGDPNPCVFQDYSGVIASLGYYPGAVNQCYGTVIAGVHGQGPSNGYCIWDFPSLQARDDALNQQRPATQSDWDGLPNPLPAIAPELPYAPYLPEGVPVMSPEYAPQTVPVGDPYTKPDGSTVQPMAKISPASDGQVTIDTYDQPLTDPQGNPVPDPQPQDTAEPQPSDCEKFPNSVGCTDLGTPPAGEDMPHNEIPITFAPVSIPADATCPAPITVGAFGQSVEIDYSGACTYASGLKPVVIAIGYLTALFIIFGVPRSAQS